MELLADDTVIPTVQAITERADIAVGSFYSHFSDKQAIIDEATAQAFSDMRRDFLAISDRVSDPVERLCLRVRLFIRGSRSNPLAARILVHSFPEPWLSWELAQATRSRVGERPEVSAVQDLTAAVAAGRLHTPRPDHSVLMLAGGAVALIARQVADPGADRRACAAQADSYTAAALAMLGLDPQAAEEMAARPLPG